jgi:hypothetical protein
MSTQRQHSSGRLAGPWRQLGFAAAILTCACLGSCVAAQPPTSAAMTPAVEATPLPSQDADLDAGTYIFDGYTIPFTFTVPEGWTYVYDRLLRKEVGDADGVFVWFGLATNVPSGACHWPGTITNVGPSVRRFADIRATQASCTRWYNSSVAQREAYVVLDLGGDRAILTFGGFDDNTDAALLEEAEAVFDSIRFIPTP